MLPFYFFALRSSKAKPEEKWGENHQTLPKISKISSAFMGSISNFTNNWRTLLPIILINLLFSTLFFFLNCLSITLIRTEVTDGFAASLSIFDPESFYYVSLLSTMREDLGKITPIGAISLVASFIVSFVITIATIHLISMANSEKKQTPQELFCVSRRTWEGPLVTQVFATILKSVSFFISILAVIFIMITIGSIGYTAASVLLAILAIIVCIYVVLICSLSIVVSVMEEGGHGVAAFERSVQLTERRQIRIMVVFVTTMGYGIISTAYIFSELYASSNKFARLVIGFGYVVILVMMTVLIHVVNSVIYCECKSYGSGFLAMEGGFGYTGMLKEDYA